MKKQDAFPVQRVVLLASAIVLLVIGCVIAIVLMRHNAQKESMYAYIYRDNELLQRIDLNEVDEPYQITFSYGDAQYNVVEVRKGSIGMVESTCPDHLCEDMGFIDNSLMPITCLPHHLVIRVTSGKTGELDAVSY